MYFFTHTLITCTLCIGLFWLHNRQLVSRLQLIKLDNCSRLAIWHPTNTYYCRVRGGITTKDITVVRHDKIRRLKLTGFKVKCEMCTPKYTPEWETYDNIICHSCEINFCPFWLNHSLESVRGLQVLLNLASKPSRAIIVYLAIFF